MLFLSSPCSPPQHPLVGIQQFPNCCGHSRDCAGAPQWSPVQLSLPGSFRPAHGKPPFWCLLPSGALRPSIRTSAFLFMLSFQRRGDLERKDARAESFILIIFLLLSDY